MIWIALAFFIICSGAISGSETALFALSRKDLQEARDSPHALRRTAHLLMQDPRSVLMTVLIANTAVNVTIFSLSFYAAHPGTFRSPVVAAAIGVGTLFAVILFGEMLPKAVALANARSIAPYAAGLLRIVQTVLLPIQRVLGFLLVDPLTRLFAPSHQDPASVSVDELRLLVEHSARDGHLDAGENDMLQAVVELTEISVHDVMTPRVDIETISLNAPKEEIRRIVETTHKRLLPVCGRDLDDIRGFLPVRRALLYPDTAIKSLLHPPEYVPEQANLAQVMQHFRTARSHIAVVVDEYGGTAGIVTNDRLVGRIVGELPGADNRESLTTAERIDENNYLVHADHSVRDWAYRFAAGEVEEHIHTVGGLVLAKLGHVPKTGDAVQIRNLTLTVDKMSRNRIEHVRIHREPAYGDMEASS